MGDLDMGMKFLFLAGALALAGCATTREARESAAAAPVTVKLIAFNDFHGNLEAPRQTVDHPGPGDAAIRVPAGGAAYLASAIDALRRQNGNNLVVSA
ncbi:MAG TPA: bifunctional metallophosphatase/5'-nucleotidase, partial [Allosphingosinicella sp.]